MFHGKIGSADAFVQLKHLNWVMLCTVINHEMPTEFRAGAQQVEAEQRLQAFKRNQLLSIIKADTEKAHNLNLARSYLQGQRCQVQA